MQGGGDGIPVFWRGIALLHPATESDLVGESMSCFLPLVIEACHLWHDLDNVQCPLRVDASKP